MTTPVQVILAKPEQVVGSLAYTLTVTVTNAGQADMLGVEVQPLVLPGRLLASSVEVKDSEETELELRRRELIDEMERQVGQAYEIQRIRALSFTEQLAFTMLRSLDIYASAFAGRRTTSLRPSWTQQAFRIHDWQDVEMLETQVIDKLKPESRLRAAFRIDKDKLRRCLAQLEGSSTQDESALPPGANLVPGASVSFPFTAKAPHLLKRRDVEAQFQVVYRDGTTSKITSESVAAKLVFLPSAFAVPTGGLVGGLVGYAIRLAFSTKMGTNPVIDWSSLFGSVLLGLVFALLTARRPETHKAITVEDFLGGFIIGVLTGMFSDSVMTRLRILFVGETPHN